MLLGHLFLGTNPKLPCEGGTAPSPGPCEEALLDLSGDVGIDLSDAVCALDFHFLRGTPPVMGIECRSIAGWPSTCGT